MDIKYAVYAMINIISIIIMHTRWLDRLLCIYSMLSLKSRCPAWLVARNGSHWESTTEYISMSVGTVVCGPD